MENKMSSEATVGTWDRCWKGRWNIGITPTRLNIFKLFSKIDLPHDSRILDVGCGSGTLAHYWQKQGQDIRALDFSDDALALTEKKGIHCIKADLTQGIPFANNHFDLVYSDGLLEHYLNPHTILSELWRVSKRYILTLVPTDDLYNSICRKVFDIPQEYLKSNDEWVAIHLARKPKQIEVKKIKFGILWILCNKE